MTMEIKAEDITLTGIISIDDERSVFVCEMKGHTTPLAVRVKSEAPSSTGTFDISQRVGNLGSNFIKTYGVSSCIGTSYLFCLKVDDGGEKEKISSQWGGTILPPLCYSGNIIEEDPTEGTIIYEPKRLYLTVMEYIPPSPCLSYLTGAQSESVLAQISCALQEAHEHHEFEHNDLHEWNILLREVDFKEREYKLKSGIRKTSVDTYEPVIIDFDYSRCMKTTPILIGSSLSDLRTESYLPRPVMTAPYVPYQDIGTLLLHLTLSPKLSSFLTIHGLKGDPKTGRPISCIISFEPVALADYLLDSVKYLHDLK